jgi:hypothetical protein
MAAPSPILRGEHLVVRSHCKGVPFAVVLRPDALKRVSVDTVREVLDRAGVPFVCIWPTIENGVVRVDVTAWPGRRLATARECVAQAFDDLRVSDWWLVRPSGRTYRWRPWRTWVTVRDPGTEWRNPDGRDFLGNRYE